MGGGIPIRCSGVEIISSDTCITGARECSPVLTATHDSNGSSCDFLLFFFQGDPWGSDRSTDRRAKWLKRRGFGQGCAFWSKN